MSDRRLSFLLFPLVFAAGLLLSCYRANIIDLPWHLAAGKWIIEHRAVPQVDMFSFTRQGLEWIDAQWLFQIITYSIYRVGGGTAITLYTMALSAALVGLALWCVPGRLPVGPRALAGFLFVMAMDTRLVPRPEMFTYIFFAGSIFLLERARRDGPRWLWPLPLISLLWVNSHGIWPIGIFLISVYAAEALWGGRPAGKPWWPWAAVALASVAAGLAQPYGLRGLLFPLTLIQEAMTADSAHRQSVIELAPTVGAPWVPLLAWPYLAMMAALLVSVALAGRRVRIFPLIIAVVFCYIGWSARRNAGLGALAMMAALLAQLGPAVERRPGLAGMKVNLATGAAAALAVLALTGMIVARPSRWWDGTYRDLGFGLSTRFYPAAAADFLHSINYRGKIINDIAAGGYLIFAGWPDWLVSSDARLEVGGGEALNAAMEVFLDDAVFARLAQESGAEAVVIYHFMPYLREFGLRRSRDPAWALVFLDQKSAVFLRRVPRWQSVIAEQEINLEAVLRKQVSGGPAGSF